MGATNPTARPSRQTIADQIADRFKEWILGGTLRPGEPLPSERLLAEQFSVNRSSIREALRRLEAWGLVEIRHGGATRVRDLLVSAGVSLLPHLFAVGRELDPAMLRDLHQLRGLLLGWCAEQAATRADASSLARLIDLSVRLEAKGVKPEQLQELDYAFFEELVRITGNRILALFANLVRDIYLGERQQFLALYAPDVFNPALHRRAIEAIRRRDPAAARAAMQAHADTALGTVGEGG